MAPGSFVAVLTSVNTAGFSWRKSRTPPAPASTRSVLKSLFKSTGSTLSGVMPPPGKGSVAPDASRTSCAFATARIGAPSPLRLMAPAQLQPELPAKPGAGWIENRSARSAGAGVARGFPSASSRSIGCAPSPGCGFRSARLSRKLGTCISTLRRKTERVAAARGSAPSAAASSCANCPRTSGGQSAP